ncbi:hypothetical protein JZ751_013462 [Albula glossodonta]|uniref:Uncharacterized protein n=1 Tax=Albula glossodonta TaxID=121402 RepID=A0A8T2MLQ5_9TELE|nr:hypothetical protein JZ751_013462 [Albula glossodonta]
MLSEVALQTALSCSSRHYADPLLGSKFAANRKSTGQLNLGGGRGHHLGHAQYGHARSNSLRASLMGDRLGDRRRSNTLDIIDGRGGGGGGGNHGSLARTRSLSSLREGGTGEPPPPVDPSNLMATIFWMAASLLESDYEFEYLLALRLLNKLLSQLPLERADSRQRIEQVQAKLKWYSFPGLQQLFLKGFTSASTLELTIHLLSKLITVSRHSLVDPSQVAGFPLNILCLLPHLIQHFDNPTPFCKDTADKMARVCAEEKSATLSNLAHMMSLYSSHSYSRDCASWVNVVCRYLHDAFSDITFSLVTYLAELLEKGLASMQQSLLQIIHSLLSHIDLSAAPVKQFNLDIMKTIGKYVQSPYWKEAQNILKLVVSRSASLVVPDEVHRSYSTESSGSPEIAFTRIFNSCSKELPGKTLDFHFDISETPIIGHKYGDQRTAAGRNGKPQVVFSSSEELDAGDTQTALIPTVEEAVREEDTGGEDAGSEQQFGVFKDFDFLDVELEDAEVRGHTPKTGQETLPNPPPKTGQETLPNPPPKTGQETLPNPPPKTGQETLPNPPPKTGQETLPNPPPKTGQETLPNPPPKTGQETLPNPPPKTGQETLPNPPPKTGQETLPNPPQKQGKRLYPTHPQKQGKRLYPTHPQKQGKRLYPTHPQKQGKRLYPPTPKNRARDSTQPTPKNRARDSTQPTPKTGQETLPNPPQKQGKRLYPTHPQKQGKRLYPTHPGAAGKLQPGVTL